MDEHRPIPEEHARKILQRAAEIDGKQSQLSNIAALRSAAQEAGIAPSAFEAALAEYASGHPIANVRRRRFLVRAAGASLVIIGLGLAMGFVARRLSAPDYSAAPAVYEARPDAPAPPASRAPARDVPQDTALTARPVAAAQRGSK